MSDCVMSETMSNYKAIIDLVEQTYRENHWACQGTGGKK